MQLLTILANSMLRLRRNMLFAAILSCSAMFSTAALGAAGRVRDVNQQRNQVTVVTNKAGEFAMGAKIYFYRNGKKTGTAQIMQAFHTKAIARIAEGNPQTGDDATTTAKPPKAAPKVHRLSFAAASVQSQEFIVDVQFDQQEKQQRKLTLNAEIAAQIGGAPGYIGLNAALVKQLDVVWENGALRVEKARLADRSSFDLTGFVAADLYAKIKPSAESRGTTVKGKIVFNKKSRDLTRLSDVIVVDLAMAKNHAFIKQGGIYKVKVYCNELFAGEFLLRPVGEDLSETMVLNPVDLSPTENNLEFRLVEVNEQGELQLETDENRLIGTLLVEKMPPDRNARVAVKLSAGQNSAVNQIK